MIDLRRPDALRRWPHGERVLCWALIMLTLGFMATVTADAWSRIGRPSPGFALMENMLVGVTSTHGDALRPFDLVRAVNGQIVKTTREVLVEVERHPAGTPIRYLLVRNGMLTEETVRSRLVTPADFKGFLVENLLAGLIAVGLGAVVVVLACGRPEARLFLGFSLVWAVINVGYFDLVSMHRFTRLFFLAWTASPALFLHLALTFPERRGPATRWPRIVLLPYALSACLYGWLQLGPSTWAATAGVIATYWTIALVTLLVALGLTARRGATPLLRQRAKVLMAGFGLGYLAPVLGTTVEVLGRVSMPYVSEAWRLGILFPLSVAYATVRYQLFDVRAVLRVGTLYSAVTAVVALAYAGLLTALNVGFAGLDMVLPPVVAEAVVALTVVLLVNPVYLRTQRVLDGLFFRTRLDAQRALERLAEAVTTTLDSETLATHIRTAVDEILHPTRVTLLLADEERRVLRQVAGRSALISLPASAPLVGCLAGLRAPLTRERLLLDPALAPARAACLRDMDALEAEVAVPVLLQGRPTALLALGPRRSGSPYTSEDLRLLRTLASQSALALEHARAYHALQAALRRVSILESIRAALSKFVPRTVQQLIEQAPEAPALAKREADVSVLFVDIVGYTRLSDRLDSATVNRLVERYFGAFLDEIVRHGGDVNETAGDGLMVIFQDPDPRRHAAAAVATAVAIVERAREINAAEPLDPPIALHVAVNSGRAAVGATKLEGAAGTRWTYTASGPVTNMAARLAELADDDVVLLGAETAARLGPQISVEDLGAIALRNVDEAMHVYRVQPRPDRHAPVG